MTPLLRTAAIAAVLAAPISLSGQEQESAEQIAEAFFEGRNHAPIKAVATCPGGDLKNDSIMATLTRRRPEGQTRQLITRWGVVPACRVGEILTWSEQAMRVLTARPYAASLARFAVDLDSLQGVGLVQAAAADAVVPPDARGAYQLAALSQLSLDEQADLYIDTFRQELQEGQYQAVGLRYLFNGPDPARTAIRLLSAVLDDYDNPRSSEVFGRIMSVATSLEQFGRAERLRVWAELETYLDRVPPELRREIVSYESALKSE